MRATRKTKGKGRHAARAAKPEKVLPAKKDPDDFVEGMDSPDEDYERGVEEISRHVHPEAA